MDVPFPRRRMGMACVCRARFYGYAFPHRPHDLGVGEVRIAADGSGHRPDIRRNAFARRRLSTVLKHANEVAHVPDEWFTHADVVRHRHANHRLMSIRYSVSEFHADEAISTCKSADMSSSKRGAWLRGQRCGSCRPRDGRLRSAWTGPFRIPRICHPRILERRLVPRRLRHLAKRRSPRTVREHTGAYNN